MKAQVSRARTGFTLVELLVVITIIAVLAALVVAGFSRMRAAGDRATTISIMRQLQIANVGYANDHNGQYVQIVAKNSGGVISMEWYRDPSFLTYLTSDDTLLTKGPNEAVTVPISVLDPVVVRAKQRQWEKLSASYGFNSTGLTPYPSDDKSPPYSYKAIQITNPTRTMFMATATDYTVTYAGRNLWQSKPVEGKSTDSKMAFRHGGKAIIVYYDGSTGFITPGDLKRFDSEGGAAHPFWKGNL